MAANDQLGPDGVPAFGSRSPFTGRQRMWVIVAIVLTLVFLIVLGTQLFTGHKRPPVTAEHASINGMPFSQPVEPKAVPAAAPHPMVAPAFPKLSAFTAAPAKDNAIEAPIFSAAGTAYQGTAAGRMGGANGSGNSEKDDEFTAAMTASGVGAAAKAHRMKHPSLTVPAGQVVPCILQTAINSELMGFVDCVLPAEVRSADGAVTLLDKGTMVMGQIKSGLRRGQERLFVLWVRARTPDNVTVDLASPAADELGRAGVTGAVNDHFWRMFWTAALYSVIQYGPELATAALQNQNRGNNSFNNYTTFLQPQQQLANTILQEDLKIPPTLEKNQGDEVSIFVARDLDFSGVYDLRMTSGVASTCNNCPVSTWTTEKDLQRNQ